VWLHRPTLQSTKKTQAKAFKLETNKQTNKACISNEHLSINVDSHTSEFAFLVYCLVRSGHPPDPKGTAYQIYFRIGLEES
jgi:hypothetical protein